VGRTDARGLMRVVAVVVAGEGADRDVAEGADRDVAEGADRDVAEGEIRRSVAHALGPHCAPTHVEWRDELPRLPSGKVARRVLREGAYPVDDA